MKPFLNSVVVFILSFLYASIYWMDNAGITRWESESLIRPYVYRQFIPVLIEFLEGLISKRWALCILVSLCGVGFYLATRAIVLHYHDTLSSMDELSVFGLCVIGLGVLGNHRWHYDLATAFFFSLSTLFLIRGESVKYLFIFPLAVLNRETSFLLIGLYILYAGFHFMEVAYQLCAFGSIQLMLRLIFWNNLGDEALIEPAQNLMKFIDNPERTIQHLTVFGIFLFLSLYGWSKKPNLKWGFVGLLSVLCVMYVVMGQAFEVRVFWEVYPLAVVLSTQTIKEIYNEKIQTTKNQKVHGLQSAQDSL